MTVTDPISDLLTRLRNGARARKTLIKAPYSKMKESICDVLKTGGYIKEIKVLGEGVAKELHIEIGENRQDFNLKSISKPGQRVYIKSTDIPKVRNGFGLAVVSTPKGIMSGAEARSKKLGGEFLCEVY